MRRCGFLLAAWLLGLAAGVGGWVPVQAGKLHEVSVTNYQFTHDETGATEITVRQGDQIRFTVRQADYPPHTVDIDELEEHSGDLLLFETYTTRPIDKAGTFILYCTPHRDRGHWTTLTVEAAPATGGAGAATPGPTAAEPAPAADEAATPAPGTGPAEASGERSPGQDGQQEAAGPVEEELELLGEDDPAPGEIAPVGRGTAEDRRRASPSPHSVEALLGRDFSESGPWTKAWAKAGAAGLPIVALAALAIAAQRRREQIAPAVAAFSRTLSTIPLGRLPVGGRQDSPPKSNGKRAGRSASEGKGTVRSKSNRNSKASGKTAQRPGGAARARRNSR